VRFINGSDKYVTVADRSICVWSAANGTHEREIALAVGTDPHFLSDDGEVAFYSYRKETGGENCVVADAYTFGTGVQTCTVIATSECDAE
jgi:hypothetical protein